MGCVNLTRYSNWFRKICLNLRIDAQKQGQNNEKLYHGDLTLILIYIDSINLKKKKVLDISLLYHVIASLLFNLIPPILKVELF